tara:strand:- start:11961 stop:12149 length:189 start_codon:yes stop_codon:yes gene_type:complete
MGRNIRLGYSGKLVLDKVTGIRHDLGQRATPIKSLVKPDTSLTVPVRSMKTAPNITRDGLKK